MYRELNPKYNRSITGWPGHTSLLFVKNGNDNYFIIDNDNIFRVIIWQFGIPCGVVVRCWIEDREVTSSIACCTIRNPSSWRGLKTINDKSKNQALRLIATSVLNMLHIWMYKCLCMDVYVLLAWVRFNYPQTHNYWSIRMSPGPGAAKSWASLHAFIGEFNLFTWAPKCKMLVSTVVTNCLLIQLL